MTAFILSATIVLTQPQPSLILTQVARIGSIDGTSALTTVTDVEIGPADEIFVVQPVDQRIKVFDARGEFVRSIGRLGKGPGEFERLVHIGFLGDTLFASDEALRRVTFFSVDGTYLRSERIATPTIGSQMPRLFLPSVPQTLLNDGTALVQAGVPAAWIAAGDARLPWFRADRDGNILDTLAWQEWAPRNFSVFARGRRLSVPQPFPTYSLELSAADGSGVVVIRRDIKESRTFTVQKIGISGDTVFRRSYRYAPIPLSDNLVEKAVREIQTTLAAHITPPPATREIIAALRANDHLPEVLPPVTAAATGSDGTIWIRREEGVSQPVVWDVLDSLGLRQATAALPPNKLIVAVSGDRVVTLERDELDVPYLTVFVVRKAGT